MENKNHLIPEEQLEQITGGTIETVYGSDGRRHPAVASDRPCCSQYNCHRCANVGEEHHPRCRTPEKDRNLCCSCSFYESVSVSKGYGCCLCSDNTDLL